MPDTFRKRPTWLIKAVGSAAIFSFLAAPVLVQAADVIVFATDPTYAPFEFVKDGELTGFDIDLVNAIAEEAGFEAKFENVPFDGIIPALQVGNYDAAVAAMVATDKRRKSIDFSDSYFQTGLVIVVGDSDASIKGEADLQGKRIAVEIGSVAAELARAIPKAEVSTFNGSPPAMLELANGNVDAVIADSASALYAIETGSVKGAKVLPDLISTDFYAVGFPKGSDKVEIVNTGLKAVIENGEYARIYMKWFGEEPPKL